MPMPVKSPKLALLLRTQPQLSFYGLFLRCFPLGVEHALRLLLPKGVHDAIVSELGRLEVAIQRLAAHLGILQKRSRSVVSVTACHSFQDNSILPYHGSETRDPVVLSVLGPRVVLSS